MWCNSQEKVREYKTRAIACLFSRAYKIVNICFYLNKIKYIMYEYETNLVKPQRYFSDISTNVDLAQNENFFEFKLLFRTQSQQLSDNGNNLFVFREQFTFLSVYILKKKKLNISSEAKRK